MAHYNGVASESGRAKQFLKMREQGQIKMKFQKKKIEGVKKSNIENKFAARYDPVHQQLEDTMNSDSDESEKGIKLSFISKRSNKNRPQEISSKAPVKQNIPKPVGRIDPRFDSLYGTFDEKIFKCSYSFLDDFKKKEKAQLKKLLKKEKDFEKKKQIKFLLERITNQERARSKNDALQNQLKEQKEKYTQGLLEGKQVSYPRKSDTKIMELLNDFEDLEKKGRLEKYMKKKSKKMSKQQQNSF